MSNESNGGLKTLVDLSMIVGPVIGYVYQYYLISIKRSIGTFSIDICGILLFANILRINFYFFQKYENALLFQSLLMVLVQLVLLHKCKSFPQINSEPEAIKIKTRIWRWPHFQQYFLFICAFSSGTALLTILMVNQDKSGLFGAFIGLLALTSESVLILPQILKNIKQQKVKGVSHLLLSLNLFGDIFKLSYFIIQNQPFQFKLCGVTQVVLDTFVIAQIFYYAKNKQQQDFEQKPEINGDNDKKDNIEIQSQKEQEYYVSTNDNFSNPPKQ